MSTITTQLLPQNWYHVYNRGINGNIIFFENRNYHFFLKLLARHVLAVAEIYAYCLLPNHFHMLVRVLEFPKKRPHLGFSQLFNSYAQAINKSTDRTGSLFERPFRRKLIQSEQYRAQLIFYVHNNPRHHEICDDLRSYPHSSYNALLSEAPTQLAREEVLGWFGGRTEFIAFHQEGHDMDVVREYIFED